MAELNDIRNGNGSFEGTFEGYKFRGIRRLITSTDEGRKLSVARAEALGAWAEKSGDDADLYGKYVEALYAELCFNVVSWDFTSGGVPIELTVKALQEASFPTELCSAVILAISSARNPK